MNITQHIERGCRFFPQKTALIFEGKSFTYKELNQLANCAANVLQGLGIKRGDCVALFLPNIPDFVISYLGILKIGAVAVSLNAMLKSDEVWFILNDCAANILITTESLRMQVPDDDLGYLKYILIAEEGVIKAPSAVDSDSSHLSGSKLSLRCKELNLLQLITNASTEAKTIEMDPPDPAAIIYTSGTTGFPKGAVLSHGNVTSNMHSVKHCCGMRAEDRLLLYLPLFHCFGQNFILNAGLNACATIILQRKFYPAEVLQVTAAEQITMFFGVPTAFAKLLEMSPDECNFNSVRYYFSAAARMPLEVVEQWQEQYGSVIHEGYGLTETSPFSCYNHYLKYKPGSIGMPIDNVEMKVVDSKGSEVNIGEVGEIIIRGPNVMSSYWNRPGETAQVMSNGWFHTGDLGRMDEEGYFYVVDRLKDIINVSGFKVSPSELERVISQHPAVAEVAICGVPDRLKGESILASIVVNNGEVLTPDDVISFCSKHMAAYKVPHQIRFVEALPKNATGKVLRRALREAYS
jgi:long-chain acyl-CoA synthetase